jgi:hypothetical protein
MRDWSETSKGNVDLDQHAGLVTVDWKMRSGAVNFEENSWMVTVEGRIKRGVEDWVENSYPGIPEIGS